MKHNNSCYLKVSKFIKLLPLILLLTVANSLNAQSDVTESTHKDVENQHIGDSIYLVVDEQPEFPGGPHKLMSFLAKNVNYSRESVRKGIQGRVVTNFIINKDGTISDIIVKEGVNEELDTEAIRVISIMPKWIPGKNEGEIVRVNFTLPVIFRLGSSSKR